MTPGHQLHLDWSERQGHSCLRIRGWTGTGFQELETLAAAELARRLVVLPNDILESGADLSSVQPIAGSFELDRNSVYFLPRFPFLDGRCYALLVYSATKDHGAGKPVVWTIQRPAPDSTPTTDVVEIYPSGNRLPVNQLKLYVHFSNPMSEGRVARAVGVRRADNNEPLEGVFLAMEPELWDPNRQRLTLLLDPGRIKRGLAPNQEAGYPLVEGVPIIVTITPDFRDATGRSLRAGAERQYEIGPAFREKINPADWQCSLPDAGSTDPLTIGFDRPLDHALLQHSLGIIGPAGLPLEGQYSVGAGELSWCFQPESPWAEGQHQLIIEPDLEDLAGNSLLRVFDRDLRKAKDAPAEAPRSTVEFTCLPAPFTQ